MDGTTAVSCLVTSTWTSSVQLVLSRINAARYKNLLELLHIGCGLHAGTLDGTSSVRLLYHDYRVIAALLRKNKAQHRAGRWWQRLMGVRRSLQDTFNLREHERFANGVNGASGVSGVSGSEASQTSQKGRKGRGSGVEHAAVASPACVMRFLHVLEKASQPVTMHQERQVPTRRAGSEVACALYQLLLQLETVLERAHAAAQACTSQLAHTFFMPLSLTGLSLSGRVYAIGVQLLREGVDLFNLLQGELMGLLPRDHGVDNETISVPTAAPPVELRCLVQRGKLVRLTILAEAISDNELAIPVPEGLQVLDPDKQGTRVPTTGLVVEEDHGQVVSRDEVYVAMGLSTHAAQQAVDIVPVFEESGIRIDDVPVGARGDGPTKRPRTAGQNDLVEHDRKRESDISMEGEHGMTAEAVETAITSAIATKSGAKQSVSVATGVQFIRIGATNPTNPTKPTESTQASARPVSAPPAPVLAPTAPPVKPLITRLEEEKRRKRNKKKRNQSSARTPWDDLF